MLPCLVDAHCHLEHSSFEGRVARVLKAAREVGVQRVVSNQGSSQDSARLLALREEHAPQLQIALGCGPADAARADFDLENALATVEKNKARIAAIGEIGLDHYWWKEQRQWEKQREVFEAFLDLAADLDKPVEVHTRDAEEEVLAILEKKRGLRVVLHHWLQPELTRRALERQDTLVCVPTLKSARRFRVLQEAPLGRLLCETDSPWAWQGMKNEPANVVEVYTEASKAKKVPLEEARDKIFENAEELFEW